MKKFSEYYNSNLKRKGFDPYCNMIPINLLLALCDISNFDEFSTKFDKLFSGKHNKDIHILSDIMKGKFVFGKEKYKKFVKKYYDVFELLNKYHILNSDILLSYFTVNNDEYCSSLYYNQYLLNHKDDIETIKTNVNKILELGFEYIYFDNEISFNDIQFEYDFISDDILCVLDNIKIIPTYSDNYLRYSSYGSFYCMLVKIDGFGENKYISNCDSAIILNDLLFDKEKLLDELNIENTLGFLVKLNSESCPESKYVNNTGNVSICLDELLILHQLAERIINSIDSLNDNEGKIHECLEALKELKKIDLEYKDSIIEMSNNIDDELLDSEKKLYLSRKD